MNKLIKEIIESAFNGFENDPVLISRHEDLQKLAELIVRECADWIEIVQDERGDRISDSFYWSGVMKKHFGIE